MTTWNAGTGERRGPRTRVDAFAYWQLLTQVAPPSEVAAAVASVHAGLGSMCMDGDPPKAAFPHAGVHLLRRDPQLVHRTRLTTFWLRLEHDERLRRGDTAHLVAADATDQHVFASSQGLHDGTILFDAYTGPLLQALTPSVWGFPSHRAFGVIVYSLGQPLAGTQGDAAELLHLVPIPGATQSSAVPQLPAPASTAALDWWSHRLDDMFGVLTDPAVFTDNHAAYRPQKHLHALLSVEQLFRRVSSLQAAHRDTNARRVLLFTVLDTLRRLVGPPVEQLCRLDYAQKTLDTLRDLMPPDAAAVLLPGAERAITALHDMQNGFFLSQQAGVTEIPLPLSGRRLSMAEAVAQYLKVLRDATHGHGTKILGQVEQTNTLLAHHDGAIPHDLGLLGYLYLLEFLVHPQRLRAKLYNSGRL